MTKPSSEVHAEALAELRTELKQFKIELIAALDKPTDHADYAETADTLEGKTPGDIQLLAIDEVTKHTQKLGVNAHGLQPSYFGAYSQQEYDAKLGLLTDFNSGLPLSFFGDREFIPPGITGSFESGSNTTPFNGVAMLMEDNGTLMILRPGTDGDTAGVYYSYLRNAMTAPDITSALVMTNVEYRPAYFPSTMNAKAILTGTQDIIIGIMKNRATGVETGYFISLTNNTMDHTKHTGVFVPSGDFLDVPDPNPGFKGRPFGFVKGNYAYILQDLRPEGKFGHRVWSIPKANLITGNFVGATRVTGWTINRGWAGFVVSDDITLFDDMASAVIKNGKPHTVVSPDNGSDMPSSISRDSGSVSVFWSTYLQYWPTDNLTPIISDHWYFSYAFDDVNKVIDFSRYWNDKPQTTYDSTGQPIYAHLTAGRPWSGFGNHFSKQQVQDTSSIYNTLFNQMWMWGSVTATASGISLERFTYSDELDPIVALEAHHVPTSYLPGQPLGRHGSALTSTFMGGGVLDEDVVVCYNEGQLDGVPATYWVRSALIGEPTFQYQSVTGNYAFKGFAPTADRKTNIDLGLPYESFNRSLCEASPGVINVSQARFTSWLPNERTRGTYINRNGVVSGSITLAPGVMESLRAQLYVTLTNMGRFPYAGIDEPLGFELIVSQAYSTCPIFVIGTWGDADRYSYQFVFSVVISGTRQNITAASLIPSGSAVMRWSRSSGLLLSLLFYPEGGQCAIRVVNDGFQVAIAETTVVNIIGTAGRAMYLLKYSAGVWTITDNDAIFDNYPPVAPSAWLNFPNRGLFYGLTSEVVFGEIDCGSKMVSTLVSTTTASTRGASEYIPRAKAEATAIIIISQRVVSAWTVFFSDEAPAMLSGFYYTVKPMNVELNPAVDANSTFYVWLIRDGSILRYHIFKNDASPPTPDALYLGYFTTNNTGLNLIDIQKRVAVGNVMVSGTARGTAMPVTSGTPNNPGRLNWR